MILKQYQIKTNDAGQRLDRFLTKQGITNGTIRKALRNKDIKVNNTRKNADYTLAVGDVLRVYLQSETPDTPPAQTFNYTDDISDKLNILYEDDNIMLLDKPVGLLSHGDTPDEHSLITQVKAYLYRKGEFVPENEQSFEPSLCNRIDRNTGGIVIAAKNAETLRTVNEMLRLRQIRKFYLCILSATPKLTETTLTAYLYKDEKANQVYISDCKTAANKTIVTKYRVLRVLDAPFDGLPLCEVELITGRTHQIRAHMAYIGCPLLGDGKYGRNAVNKRYGGEFARGRQALYSYKVEFVGGVGTCLDYLNGRAFEVKLDDVWFV